MVKGKDIQILNNQEEENKFQNSQNEQPDFLFEEELNQRILNRKRRNALTTEMVKDIKDMIKNGEFDFES